MKMFCITEDGYMLASEPFNPITLLNTVNQALMQVFVDCIKHVPEEHKENATQELYDAYNLAASEFLAAFAPEIELRPDLTVEAILEAENNLLKEKAATIQDDTAVQQTVNHIKKQMEDDGLIPLNSLDENGKPKVAPFRRKE